MKRATRDTRSAAALYRRFREAPARRAKRVSIDLPDAVAVMGHVLLIAYETTHDGEVTFYAHEFAPGSRPLFCAGTRKNQAFLIGGRYRVTERGIVDMGVHGREAKHRPRYKVVRNR